MQIKERIKLLRKKYLNLTQDKFASKIKISRSNLGSIEIGRINVTDRVIEDICYQFNINEKWLRTGQGEVFKTDSESELDYLIRSLASDGNKFKIKFIKFMCNQPEERWDMIEKMIKDYVLYDNEMAVTDDNRYIYEQEYQGYSYVAEAEAEYKKNVLKNVPERECTALNTTEDENLEKSI